MTQIKTDGVVPLADISEIVKTGRLIQSYFHCAKCMREDSRPNIAVGVIGSGTHLQVWCETHELSLGLFELQESETADGLLDVRGGPYRLTPQHTRKRPSRARNPQQRANHLPTERP